jgi:outer membrane protein OmpU
MKKLLFASTALVLVAGAAAAEVKVTGDGRMGIYYNGDNWNFASRIRIKFAASGETDGGLSFGGSVRADNSGSGAHGAAGSVFISGSFGTLSMGDVVGAAEAVLFDLPEVGYTDLSGYNELPFLTGDGALTSSDNPVVLYTYTTGSLTFALSLSDGYDGNDATIADTVSSGTRTGFRSDLQVDQEYAIGASYSFGDYTVGLGYEVLDFAASGVSSTTQITLGGSAAFGDTTVKAYYAQRDAAGTAADINFYGLGVSSVFGAVTVNAFANHYDYQAAGATDITGYGLGGVYDLGGGASVVGGVASTDASGDSIVADVGMKFTF